MMKYLLILLLLITGLFANKLQVINSMADIPKNRDVILVFSLKFCPYCRKQEKSILKRIQPKFHDIAYLKVIKNTKIYDRLMDTGNFGEVEYYPTTFILKIDDDNNIDVKYPFKGLQKSSNIIRVLKDKDIMAD